MVNGSVVQFRRGRKRIKPRQFLLEVDGVDSRDKAEKFVGKMVEWKSEGKKSKLIRKDSVGAWRKGSCSCDF